MAALTALVGLVIYGFGLRGRKRQSAGNSGATTTGTIQVVSSEDIPEFRRR
jgi:hypothetical protein